MNIFDMLYDTFVNPAKENLKNELITGMDKCSRILVVTQRIGIELNLFDSSTYADILNQQANKHYEATKNMTVEELMAYMSEGGNTNDTKDV